MKPDFMLPVFVVTFLLMTSGAVAEGIVDAHYANPVDRYGHFALGQPHEYSSLKVTTEAGDSLTFTLPGNEVFEDLRPRIIRLSMDEPEEILSIVSGRDVGSRLVLFQIKGNHLELSAQSPAIGTPMRWLNPVGVADLDGDGRAEIAAVITPHIGGTLKVYRKQEQSLVEISSLAGFSNHVYRTSELALSTPILIGGRQRLLVPDATRLRLRFVGLQNNRLVETGLCRVPEPVIGPIRVISPTEVSIRLHSGREMVVPKDCSR